VWRQRQQQFYLDHHNGGGKLQSHSNYRGADQHLHRDSLGNRQLQFCCQLDGKRLWNDYSRWRRLYGIIRPIYSAGDNYCHFYARH
jgi:hypothetical protein